MLGVPRHGPLAQNDETIDHDSFGDGLVAGELHVAARIVGAIARDVDGAARAFDRRALQLSGRELDPAADRSAVGERSGQFQELVAEFTGRAGTVDDGPIDHKLLRAEARPFDEAERNALLRTGFDRVHHLRIGDRRRIAFALQQEFRMIDAARNVGRQREQEVDLLGGKRACRGHQSQRSQRQQAPHQRQRASNHAVHDRPPGLRHRRVVSHGVVSFE